MLYVGPLMCTCMRCQGGSNPPCRLLPLLQDGDMQCQGGSNPPAKGFAAAKVMLTVAKVAAVLLKALAAQANPAKRDEVHGPRAPKHTGPGPQSIPPAPPRPPAPNVL